MDLLGASIAWILAYRYAVLFPIMVVEGPVITVVAGFLASMGQLNFWIALVMLVAGDLAGDTIYYTLGRGGRWYLLGRWGKYVGLTPERVAQLEQHFGSHAAKTLLVGKISHGIGAALLVAAGVARVPFLRFILINFIGSLPKTYILLLVGFYFGRAYVQISRYLGYFGITLFVAVVVGVAAYFFLWRRKRAAMPK